MQLDFKFAFDAPSSEVKISLADWEKTGRQALKAVAQLNAGQGNCEDKGIKMLGWQTYARNMLENKTELARIKKVAERLRQECDIIYMIGIGGSYLGGRAVIEAIYGPAFNELISPQIYFLGADTDPVFLDFCLKQAVGKRVGAIVISKSGTTLEPAMALRMVMPLIGDKKSELRQRLVAVTDGKKGALKTLATEIGLDTFVIPDDIGGRFSVMTPVGLVSIATAGIDIESLLQGFVTAQTEGADEEKDFELNLAAQLAAWRATAWKAGARSEYQVTNSQAFGASIDWVTQLEAESEGHEGHGMHIIPALFPRDLHSFGQLIQQGPRNLIEIATRIQSQVNLRIPPNQFGNLDNLDFLLEKKTTLETINQAVIDGALQAHYQNGAASVIIDLGELTPFTWGQYAYMMMKATAISGYLMGHNPFTQPGVQAWKDELGKIIH